MRRPCPARSAASTAAWPPAPNVASTTVSPGSTARSSRTSSARTGTWSAVSCCKAFRNNVRPPFDIFKLDAPGVPVPHLEVVAGAGHDDLAAQIRLGHQACGERHAPLLVELGLDGRGEE